MLEMETCGGGQRDSTVGANHGTSDQDKSQPRDCVLFG